MVGYQKLEGCARELVLELVAELEAVAGSGG
jgi:hypothetical protein